MINFGHLYMMFDSSGRMWSCAVWKSFNQLSSWWLLCKRYAYTLIRVSRHYYVIRMFLLCLCIFVSNKAFWSWSWSWSLNCYRPFLLLLLKLRSGLIRDHLVTGRKYMMFTNCKRTIKQNWLFITMSAHSAPGVGNHRKFQEPLPNCPASTFLTV